MLKSQVMVSAKKISIIIINVLCIGFFIFITWTTIYYYKERPNITTSSSISTETVCSVGVNETTCGPTEIITNPAIGLKILAGALLIGAIGMDIFLHNSSRIKKNR